MGVSVPAATLSGQRRQRPFVVLAKRVWGLWRVRVGLALICLRVALVVIGPFFAPYPPSEFVGVAFEHPSHTAVLGTDYLGRDVLSRLLWGGRTVLGLSLASAGLGVALGALVGLIAAYSRGIVDDVLMRSMDFILAF